MKTTEMLTCGIFYCRDSAGINGCGSLQTHRGLTVKCFEIGNKNIPLSDNSRGFCTGFAFCRIQCSGIDSGRCNNRIGLYRGILPGGGIIFYINMANGTGLVCAIRDSGSMLVWSSLQNNTGATSTDIGKGQSNTTAIINSDGKNAAAAYYCHTLSMNGYSDWFLPSQYELKAMNDHKDKINVTAIQYGGSSFELSSWGYWSSTEGSRMGSRAIRFDDTPLAATKDFRLYVRAVRAF